MTIHAEASPQATCQATTRQGNPCRKPPVERGLCVFHSGKLDLAELGRRGGRARRKREEQAGDRLERIAHAAIEELLLSSGNATARAAAARLVIDKLSVSSSLSMGLARRAASEEIRAQVEAEAPAMRERLERLIEGRARALAREAVVEVERRAVEAEARLAEFTAGPEPRAPTQGR